MQEKLNSGALFLAITVTWDPAEPLVATSHHQLTMDMQGPACLVSSPTFLPPWTWLKLQTDAVVHARAPPAT